MCAIADVIGWFFCRIQSTQNNEFQERPLINPGSIFSLLINTSAMLSLVNLSWTMRKSFILVAEDDADDRFLLQTAFTEKGYNDRLEFVENGIDLITYLQDIKDKKSNANEQYPGFILLDLNMPRKSGREALEEIKQHPVFKSIPIVVYTTTRNESEIRKCYELGANTYIVKPSRFESLLQVVEDIRSYWFATASIPNL